MSYSLVRVSAAVSPVSLQQLKHHLRIELEETYEDDYLQDLIADAVEYVEHQADITIPQTTWRLSFPVVQSTQVIHSATATDRQCDSVRVHRSGKCDSIVF